LAGSINHTAYGNDVPKNKKIGMPARALWAILLESHCQLAKGYFASNLQGKTVIRPAIPKITTSNPSHFVEAQMRYSALGFFLSSLLEGQNRS